VNVRNAGNPLAGAIPLGRGNMVALGTQFQF